MQTRDRYTFGIWKGPGSAAHHFMLRRARDKSQRFAAFFNASAFGQKAGGVAIFLGARANQSPQTSSASQRWQASTICASKDTPVGQAAGLAAGRGACLVSTPSRTATSARWWAG